VTLTGIRGRAADGELGADATLDFRRETSQFQFNVSANRLALQHVPPSWGLPKLDGRLAGRADMQVSVRNGEIETRGQGQGTIEGFLGRTLKVQMSATERGYRFDISDTLAAALDSARWIRVLALAATSIQPPSQPQRPAKEPVKDLEINFGLRDVDVAELLHRLTVTLPFKLEGKLTFQVKAAVPLRDVKDLKAYRFNGTVSLPWAKLENLELQEVKARVVYDQGVARLEELSARIPAGQPNAPPGRINGMAQLGVVPAGDLTAKLTVATVPVGPLLSAIPNLQAAGGGTADGEVQLRAPAGALRDLQRWDANARLTAKGVNAFGRSAEELAFQAQLRNGAVSVSEARGRLNGASISGSGQLQLAGQYPFSARVELPPSELSSWQQVIPELRSVRLSGKARSTLDARGMLDPLTVRASGDAQVDGLAVIDFNIGSLRFHLDADPDRLRLSNFAAGLYGGELTGSATLPLKTDVAGNIALKLNKLDTGNLTKDVESPVQLEGTAQGSVTVNIPTAPEGGDREITADIQLQAERLRIQNIPADRLQAKVTYRRGVADYHIDGETLGGKFELSGKYPQQPQAPRDESGRLNIRGIELSRLAGAIRSEALRPLGGRLDLNGTFHFGRPDAEPTGSGLLTINTLSWGGQTLTDRLSGEVRVGGGMVSIPELAGLLGGGNLRLRLTHDYHRPERSIVIVTAQHVDAATLFAPFTQPPPLEGPLDARLVTRLGGEWSGSGQVVLPYGKLLGVTIRDARFPLGWTVVPGRRGELRLADASAQASRGRLTARAELAWGETARLDGQAQFSAVDVGELLSHYSETKVVGGLANGRVVISGRNMRSATDLTARVDATLAQATPSQLPVFRQVMPFVLPGVGANMQFQSGDIRGALSGGVFRIERLTLTGDLARLYADGTVTLQQRLNLNVVANTSQLGLDPAVLQIFNLALPAVGPVPLGLLNQATNYLSNRTISLRVAGTIRAPSVQINPVPFLTESVVRYFVSQTGVPVPAAAQTFAFPYR
jgi:translocation and assembly module TamB